MNNESLRGLVEKWAEKAERLPAGRGAFIEGQAEATANCAKELESLLNQAPAVGQAAEGWVLVPSEAVLNVARQAEALKRECSMDPESGQAIRNSQYMAISYALRELLSAAPAAPVAELPPHRLCVTLQSIVESARCLGIAQCSSNGDAVPYWTDKVNAYVTIAKGQAAAPVSRCSCPSGDGSLDWPCKAHGAAPSVYAVPTGDTSESGDETYTLHDKPVPMADNVRVASAPVAYPSEDHGCVYENGDGVCRECADLAAAIKASAPATEVDEAMVDRALAVMFPGKYDEHLRKNWRETTRNALSAALGQEKG